MKTLKKLLIESEQDKEPLLFKYATENNTYETVDGNYILKFESKEFKDNWCRLKYRVYSKEYGNGGYLIDVILTGDMDDLLYQIDNITKTKKQKHGSLSVIRRKINNIVPVKYQNLKII